jgi:hypothetical protein
MVRSQSPPGTKSNWWIVFVNPAGPHHLATRSGADSAANTCCGVACMRMLRVSDRRSMGSMSDCLRVAFVRPNVGVKPARSGVDGADMGALWLHGERFRLH